MIIVSYGLPGVVLLIVAAAAVGYLGRRVILRRRAARRVERWTREFIDPMGLLAEITQPDVGAVNRDDRSPGQ